MESPIRDEAVGRAEYDRLIEIGVFQPGDALELLGGELVVGEPQGEEHYIVDHLLEVYRQPAVDASAPFGWSYASRETLGADAFIAPLVAPHASVAVAALLP
jgi:hypothetical protein